MAYSTIERAYMVARSGDVADLAALVSRLKSDGCRAVDALLAPRAIRGHLQAICVAASSGASLVAADSGAPAADARAHEE